MRKLGLAAVALAAAVVVSARVVFVSQATKTQRVPAATVAQGSNNTGCVRQLSTMQTLLCVHVSTNASAR
jgi:hypothetical protein